MNRPLLLYIFEVHFEWGLNKLIERDLRKWPLYIMYEQKRDFSWPFEYLSEGELLLYYIHGLQKP